MGGCTQVLLRQERLAEFMLRACFRSGCVRGVVAFRFRLARFRIRLFVIVRASSGALGVDVGFLRLGRLLLRAQLFYV